MFCFKIKKEILMIYPQRAGHRVVFVVVLSNTRISIANVLSRLYRRTTSKRLRVGMLLLFLFLAFSVLVANPKKTTLHGGQSRSWSAEQRKKKNWQPPPPPPTPHAARLEKKKNKNHATHLHVFLGARESACAVVRTINSGKKSL